MYITNAQVASFLNVTFTPADQAAVDDIVAAVEEYANSYCNRLFVVSGNQTEKFDGGVDAFFVKYPPINTIVSVTIDGSPYSLTDVFNYKSYVKLQTKLLAGRQNVVIVYTSGITLPNDLKHALIRWTGQIFKSREDGGKDVSRVTVGSVSIDWLIKEGGIPDFVLKVLNRYRLDPI